MAQPDTCNSKVIISFLELDFMSVFEIIILRNIEFCVLDPFTHSSLIHSVYSSS